jgi:hypothetical protein
MKRSASVLPLENVCKVSTGITLYNQQKLPRLIRRSKSIAFQRIMNLIYATEITLQQSPLLEGKFRLHNNQHHALDSRA